jgi:PAS domain S-box-containing protein
VTVFQDAIGLKQLRLQALFDQAPVGFAFYDPEFRYIDVNHAFAAVGGRSREEHLGRTLTEMLPRLANQIAPALQAVFATGQPVLDFSLLGPRAPGSNDSRQWLVSYLPVHGAAAVIAVLAVVRETTKEARTERLLQAVKRILEQLARGDRLDEILDLIAQAVAACAIEPCIPSILLLDADGIHLLHGAAPGLPAAYTAALDGTAIGPSVGSCGTAAYLRATVVVDDILTDPRWEMFRPLAIEHGLRACWSTPIFGSDGRVLGTFALYYREPRTPSPDDLELVELMSRTTALAIEWRRGDEDRRRLFEAERRAREEAEAANRSKDEFVAALSHELRTPLNAILGWISMLRGGAVRPGARERALAAIDRNTSVQQRLVDDLLDISRIVTGKMRIERTRVCMARLAESAVETVRPQAEAKGVLLEVQFPAGECPCHGDPDRLKQVVWNLLVNAIKFTPSGGRVALTVRRAPASVRVIVADTGAGIEPALLPHIFERFRQGERGVSAAISGLGLGLAIARHIVDLHGGSLTAHSDGPNRGATFELTVPALAAGSATRSQRVRAGTRKVSDT